MLSGRPDGNIVQMPSATRLSIPLRTKRFTFSDIKVVSAQKVSRGQVLAVDPDNFDLPLLASANGTVALDLDNAFITLTDISNDSGASQQSSASAASGKIERLFRFGAWEYFYDAFTCRLPDPSAAPQAVIVSTLSLEPFLIRGDVRLNENIKSFATGIEHLASICPQRQIHLVLPKLNTPLVSSLLDLVGSKVNIVHVDLKYPYDHANIVARHLNLRSADGAVWSLKTEGVLAVDKVLSQSCYAVDRVISIAGPAVEKPTNISVPTGFAVADIVSKFGIASGTRIIDGGILTGKPFDADVRYVDGECRGITFVPEHTGREFLGWLRPGFDRHSYSNSFGSAIRPPFREGMNTAVRGEVRPCISCNFCENVCPAGIMPHVLHKYIYADQIDELQASRIDLCILCGLCTYVCTSKLELNDEFAQAMAVIEEEKQAARLAEERQKAESENKQE